MIGLYICVYRFLLYGCSEAVFLETLILGKIIFIFRIRYKLVAKHPASGLVIRLQGINVGTITAHYSDLTAGAIGLFLYGKNAAYRNYIIDKILKIHFVLTSKKILIIYYSMFWRGWLNSVLAVRIPCRNGRP